MIITYEDFVKEEAEQDLMKNKVIPIFQRTYSNVKGPGQLWINKYGKRTTITDLGNGMGLVKNIDGTGTKYKTSALLEKYYGLGLDITAANTHDTLCLGARPIEIGDYISAPTLNERVESAILEFAHGLEFAAQQAKVVIGSGETAQDLDNDPNGLIHLKVFGIAYGLVGLSPERTDLLPLLTGEDIIPGDEVIGICTKSLQTNGFRFVDSALRQPGVPALNEIIEELEMTLGDALLYPADIFVQALVACLEQSKLKGIANISGGGLTNLDKLVGKWSCFIDSLPPIPPLIRLIQKWSQANDAELCRTLCMGIGVAVVCDPASTSQVLNMISEGGHYGEVIGRVIDKEGKYVYLPQFNLVGSGESFLEIS